MQKEKIKSSRPRAVLFAMFLALIPLPLASNSPVFWSAMAIIAAIFLIYNTFSTSRRYFNFNTVKLPIALFMFSALWALVQIVPMPSGIANPMWQTAAAELNAPNLIQRISISPQQTIIGITRLLAYFFIFLIAAQLGTSSRNSRLIFRFIGISSAIYALYGLVVFFLGNEAVLWLPKTSYLDDLTGNFISRNNFASYLGIGIIINAMLLTEKLLKKDLSAMFNGKLSSIISKITDPWVILPTLSLIIQICAISLTHSRAGIASLMIAAFISGLACAFSRQFQPYRSKIFTALATIAATCFFIIISSSSNLIERLFLTSSDLQIRLDIYTVTWRAIMDNLFLGTGLGSFDKIFMLYKNPPIDYSIVTTTVNAHSTYLENLLELGIIGAIPLFLACFLLLVKCAKGISLRHRNVIFPITACGTAILAATHSAIDFSLEIPAITATVAAIVGVGLSQAISSKDEEGKTESPTPKLCKISMTALAVCLITLATPQFISAKAALIGYAARHQKPYTTQSLEQWSQSYEKAQKYWPTAMSAQFLASAYHHLANRYSQNYEERLGQALSAIEHSLKLAPSNPYAWFHRAKLQAMLLPDFAPATKSLELSYLTGGYESYLAPSRLKLAALLWQDLTPEQKEPVLHEVKLVWNHNHIRLTEALMTSVGEEMVTIAMGEEALDKYHAAQRHIIGQRRKKELTNQ